MCTWGVSTSTWYCTDHLGKFAFTNLRPSGSPWRAEQRHIFTDIFGWRRVKYVRDAQSHLDRDGRLCRSDVRIRLQHRHGVVCTAIILRSSTNKADLISFPLKKTQASGSIKLFLCTFYSHITAVTSVNAAVSAPGVSLWTLHTSFSSFRFLTSLVVGYALSIFCTLVIIWSFLHHFCAGFMSWLSILNAPWTPSSLAQERRNSTLQASWKPATHVNTYITHTPASRDLLWTCDFDLCVLAGKHTEPPLWKTWLRNTDPPACSKVLNTTHKWVFVFISLHILSSSVCVEMCISMYSNVGICRYRWL